MINEESILSVFDGKPTLYQWLRKVEAALKNASATEFHVNKIGNATFSFSIDFADGTSLESERFVLNQGESVTNAEIKNGHLILTLSNGDTLDAGNTGAVSGFFINAAQHLIVQYQDGTTNDLGAIFNGSITINGDIAATGDILGSIPVLTCAAAEIQAQKPVVEVMNGYTYTPAASPSGWEKETVYVGVCKNGNKLTCVMAFNFKRVDPNAGASVGLGDINMPIDVLNKIYTVNVGGVNLVARTNVLAADAYQTEGKQVPVWVGKGAYSLQYGCNLVSLIDNVKYYIRIEHTFLLSENLAA